MQNPRSGWNVLILILVLSLILSPRLIAGGLDLQSACQLDASGDATHAVVKFRAGPAVSLPA